MQGSLEHFSYTSLYQDVWNIPYTYRMPGYVQIFSYMPCARCLEYSSKCHNVSISIIFIKRIIMPEFLEYFLLHYAIIFMEIFFIYMPICQLSLEYFSFMCNYVKISKIFLLRVIKPGSLKYSFYISHYIPKSSENFSNVSLYHNYCSVSDSKLMPPLK